MMAYTVKKLSKISGVSVRTLHHYDKIGLLKPALRTEKNYRIYGESELYRLQQILFHRELGMSLSQISDILNNEQPSPIEALEEHKKKLKNERFRILQLIETIDKTISKIEGKTMITDKELYEGFSNTNIEDIRTESKKKFGLENFQRSEKHLKKYSKEEFEMLKNERLEIFQNLLALKEEEIESKEVQLEIARHYTNTRKSWGTYGSAKSQKVEYKALGTLYLNDERYTRLNGKQHVGFSRFLSEAMDYYVKTQLR